jgi:hypothetical protein
MIAPANIAAPVTAEANAQGLALMNRNTIRSPPPRMSRAVGVSASVMNPD